METQQSPFFERSSTIIIGIAGILILLISQVFLWGYVRKAARELHMRQTNEQQYEMLSLKLLEAEQNFLEQQKSLGQLSEILPSQETISQVLGQMESLADAKKVTLELKSIEDADPIEAGADTIAPRVFSAEAAGPIEDLLAFLESLEHQKQLSRIESWDISSAGPLQDGSFQSFVLRIQIVYYFL